MADDSEDSGQINPGADTGAASSRDTPSIDTDPKNPEGPGTAPVSPVGDDDYYLKKQSDLLATHHEREEHYRTAFEGHLKELEKSQWQMQQDIEAQKNQQPQLASPQTQQMQQIQGQLRGGGGGGGGGNGLGIGGTILGIVALGAIAATVFGRKKNPYVQGALMGGIGAMMHNYAKGRHDRVAELKQEWHQLNDLNNQQNRERTRNLRETMQDKRLNLQQQMDIMRMYGDLYKDERLIGDSDSRNVGRIEKNIHDKEKASERVDSLSHQGGFTSGERAQYRDYVIRNSGGALDPQKPSDRSTALQRYPYGDFLKEYYTEKEQAKAAAKKAAKNPKAQGGIDQPNDRLGIRQ